MEMPAAFKQVAAMSWKAPNGTLEIQKQRKALLFSSNPDWRVQEAGVCIMVRGQGSRCEQVQISAQRGRSGEVRPEKVPFELAPEERAAVQQAAKGKGRVSHRAGTAGTETQRHAEGQLVSTAGVQAFALCGGG